MKNILKKYILPAIAVFIIVGGARIADAYIYNPTAGGGSATISIGSAVTGGTTGSTLFIDGSSNLAQDNNNYYIQDNATTPTTLSTNTNVAVSINTNGDFTGTDALNIYAQMDAFLPNSAITNSTTGLNTDGATPGYTASSARGTGPSPVQLQNNDLAGGFSGWGAEGASSPTYQNLGGMFVYAKGSSTNNLGGELDFYTKADGGLLTKNMTISNAGLVTITNLAGTGNRMVIAGSGGALSTQAITSGTVTSVTGTTNQIDVATGTTTPVISIDAGYVGQSSITTLGTIGTGVWQGTVVGATYGGTGVNNGSSTITLAGNLVTSGANSLTLTTTGTTNVTLPTSGTLLTTTGSGASLTGIPTSVSNSDGTLTISPTTGSVVASLALAHANTWTGAQTISTAPFAISGNQSAAAWGLNGQQFNVMAATLTDNSTVSGTVTNNMVTSFGIPTLAATNASITYTNAATVYIAGLPVAGTNATLTNRYSLLVNAGIASLQGGLSTNGSFVAANLFAAPLAGSTTSTSASVLFGGASTVNLHAAMSGTTSTAMGANNSYANVIAGSTPVTVATSGTTAWLANMVVNPLGTVTNTQPITISNTATMYVGAAGSGGTNNYALYVSGPVASAATQTVVNCSTSGTVTYSQPENGPSYKLVIAYASACLGTASYTFPIAFTNTPDSLGVDSVKFTSISTSAVTFTGTTTTGFSQLYGY